MMRRMDANPLLSPDDLEPTAPGLKVVSTLNPGAVRFGKQVLLVVRVAEAPLQTSDAVSTLVYDAGADEVRTVNIPKDDPTLDTTDPRKYRYGGRTLLTSMSHLRVARSKDGEHFVFDPAPAIFPAAPYEAFGCEDARVTHIDGRYYITYTAVSQMGVTVALASTEDFKTFKRHGVIFPPYNKDVCIFPQKVRGKYVCRHRPYKSEFNPAAIWTGYSPDLLSWGDHHMTLAPQGRGWMSERVGAGAPPIRTEAGWIEIFHACDEGRRYCLGAMLSDLDHPEKIIARSSGPVLEPQTEYERAGLFGDVVFSNGLIAHADGQLTVYYGAADSICAAAVTTIDEMIAAAKK